VSAPRHHGTSRQQHQRTRFETQYATAREFRQLADLAQAEAAERGAAVIEAEHVLIALAGMAESRGGAFLVANGLDRDALDEALLAERRHSLRSVGAPVFGDEQLVATRRKLRPRFGASSREALERGMRVSPGRENASTLNFVVGALMAELGTVPRMLALAGVDRHQILGRATVEAAKGQR
jgi:D-alanyl-D-alanine carboxypeptidase